MVRALAFVLSLVSLLLCASSALSQPTACTRYENGRLYILPDCPGPGGSTSGPGRVHPFTGVPWSPSMEVLSWNGFAASATMMSWPLPVSVEGPLAVRLTASFQEPTAGGARISRIRITTKDLIEHFEQDFGVSGKERSLVRRRKIDDLAGEEAEIYLVVDGVDHLVESFIEPIALSFPEGIQASASAFGLSPGDGALTSFKFQKVSTLAIGDLAVDGFSMDLFSLERGRFVWAALPGQDGFLLERLTAKVTGGMQMSESSLESPLPVTGTLKIGPEKVVSP